MLSVSITDGGKAMIAVRDHGAGMNRDQLQRIGQRFARDASNPQSAGLGLAIVAEVAEFHHGSIETRSGSDGGFEVGIVVPLTAAPDATGQGDTA